MNVATSLGVFEVRKSNNNNNFTEVYYGKKCVACIKADWWNKDAIIAEIEKEKDTILAQMKNVGNIAEKDVEIASLKNRINILESEQNKVNVSYSNVVEVLEKANNVLADTFKQNAKKRGFVCSRLSQVINKVYEDFL